MPAEEDNNDLPQERINSQKNSIAPEDYAFTADPRNQEQTKHERAELTDLGKNLLGLENFK